MKPLFKACVGMALCAVTFVGCFRPIPPQGPTILNIPYHAQQAYNWCVPAAVVMWREHLFGYDPAATQQAAWNYATQNYGTHVGPLGMNPPAIIGLASYALGRTVVQANYTNTDQNKRQAIADLGESIARGQPAMISINNFTHVVLLTGASWVRRWEPFQRPDASFVYVHEPAGGCYGCTSPANAEVSVGVMMNNLMPAGNLAASNFMDSGLQGSGVASLQAFDEAGGLYTGPGVPNPSGRYRYDGNGQCYWEANDFGNFQCSPPGQAGPNTLEPGERLYPGQYKQSNDHRFSLHYQWDGNLVLYGPNGAYWATMVGHNPGYVEMQHDGNVVVYDSQGAAQWATMSFHAGAHLVLQDDGNMLVYAGGMAVWATNTGGQ